MNDKPPLLCCNCIHFGNEEPFNAGAQCMKVKPREDLVYGLPRHKLCVEVRSALGECGPGGFLFEPREGNHEHIK